MTALLEDLTAAGRHIAREAARSVVGVGRRGTGVVVGPGLVATNAHNLRHDDVTVTFADGRTDAGRARSIDLDGDLAVVEVDTGDVPAIVWADEPAEPGQAVFALANPGGRGARLTFGVVASVGRSFRGPRGRRIGNSIEHTAPLPRGSSGGPVVDAAGRAVGLNTHRVDEGFYLAQPADDDFRTRLAALEAGTTPTRRTVGIAVVPPRVARRLRAAVGLPERDGLLVRAVDPDGPAASAGVREGDLVVQVGDRAIASVDDLYTVLDTWTGDTCDLLVVRGSDEITITISFS